MITNQFNLCGQCMHLKNCVLTNQKEKVFSCSEFDEKTNEEPISANSPTISRKIKASSLELEMAV